ACLATRARGEQSEETLDLRMICLSQRHAELQATSDLFVGADRGVIEKAADLATRLSPVSECADVEALKTPLRLPREPALRAEVAAVRVLLARVKALGVSGRYKEGLPAAEQAVARARATAYAPVQAEALLRLGHLQL